MCAESVNMLEGLTEDEAEWYFCDHKNIIPLYEVNVAKIARPYQTEFSQERAELELELEEVNISDDGQPRPILVAKHLPREFKKELTQTLREYRDVFA